jgi:outer membrane protein
MRHAGVVVLLVLVGAGVGWGAEVKIGYVDLQRALNESDAGKAARDRFREQMERMQGSLKRQKEELERLRDDFDKKALVVRDQERRNLEKDVEQKSLDFKRKYEDYQRELKRTDNELTGAILVDLETVVRELGEREGFTVILETSSSAILYGAPGADLTDEVIRTYNSRGAGVGKAKD